MARTSTARLASHASAADLVAAFVASGRTITKCPAKRTRRAKLVYSHASRDAFLAVRLAA